MQTIQPGPLTMILQGAYQEIQSAYDSFSSRLSQELKVYIIGWWSYPSRLNKLVYTTEGTSTSGTEQT